MIQEFVKENLKEKLNTKNWTLRGHYYSKRWRDNYVKNLVGILLQTVHR
jgi:hypothetical protein